MDDLLALAARTLNLKLPCERCGQPFLQGTETACSACLRKADGTDSPTRRYRLRCDCGEIAAAVIYVSIKPGGVISQEPLALCRECLRIEIDTVMNYFRP